MDPEIDIAEVYEKLRDGSTQCVFVDDGGSGFHNMPTDAIVQSHLMYAAVLVPADRARALIDAQRIWIEHARQHSPRVDELHATELVNPKSNSTWAGVEQSIRIRLLELAGSLFLPQIDHMLLGEIGGEQYTDVISQARQRLANTRDNVHKDYNSQHTGLERNFYKALAHHLIRLGKPSVIVQDEGRNQTSFHIMYETVVPVWNHGIAYLPSKKIPGIQVTDLVAFLANRRGVIRARQCQGKPPTRFDEVCTGLWSTVGSRVRDAWAVPLMSSLNVT